MSDHRQGRVRSEAARVAILEATARLFAERGYDHLTMEGVAVEAGVAKQTIYRWWSSKGALVADTLLEGRLMPGSLTVPNEGTVRDDLEAWLSAIFQLIERPEGEPLVRSLVAAAAENADVGRRLEATLGANSSVTERLLLAVDAGELAADSPLEAMGAALLGALVIRALARAPYEPEFSAQLVSVILGRPRG